MLPDRRNKDDLRAHLTNVELQIKSVLQLIASESRESQQAHSALARTYPPHLCAYKPI